MKDNELTWIILTIVFLSLSALGIYFFGIQILGFVHIFIVISFIFIYGIVSLEKTRYLERVCPKKGKECFCYIYDKRQGDNDSVIFSVVVNDENINKIAKYHSYDNIKFKCGQVVKGYYYKNKIVLDSKNIDIKKLPSNIIEAFELED